MDMLIIMLITMAIILMILEGREALLNQMYKIKKRQQAFGLEFLRVYALSGAGLITDEKYLYDSVVCLVRLDDINQDIF